MPNYNHPELSATRSMAERGQRGHANQYRIADMGGPVAAVIVWLLVPFGLSVGAKVMGAILILLIGPVDWLIWKFVPQSAANFSVILFRALVAIAVAAIVPAAFFGALVIGTSLVLGSLHTESQRRMYGALVLVAVGFSVTGLLHDVENWPIALAMVVVACSSSELWHRAWRSERNEIDRRHDEMLERAMIFSWEADANTGEFLSVAGNVEAVLGYTAEELAEMHIFDVVDRSRVVQVVEEYGMQDGVRHAEVRAWHRDGHEVRLREVRLEDAVDTADGVFRGVSVDVSELAQAKEALRYQAEHDALTGLANRTLVKSFVTQALAADGGSPVALLVADLDRFKEINDTLGHPSGDRLLTVLAQRFEAGLEDLDVVARIGGDEFAFVVQGALSPADALAISERIHELATSPIEVDGLVLAVACSVGVALSPDHGTTYDDLMKHADIATYQCKRSGGGVLLFAADPDELSRKRWRLLSEISGAIDRGEFELFMQPKVSLETGEIVGVEGLARWRHPELGLLMPGDFLHALEVAADYHRFTNEVIRQGIHFAATARSAGRPVNVAINLGSMSFLDRSLPTRLAAMLDAYDLPGSSLTFEVTELDLLDEQGADAPVLDAVAELGVQLSIDDFGTGYSSFKRLRALSVDEVKIDRSFVWGLGEVVEDEILVEMIVQLCQVLGLSVVAEGVETLEQLQALQRFGCGSAQGYHFARPMPQADALALLEADTRYLDAVAPASVAEGTSTLG